MALLEGDDDILLEADDEVQLCSKSLLVTPSLFPMWSLGWEGSLSLTGAFSTQSFEAGLSFLCTGRGVGRSSPGVSLAGLFIGQIGAPCSGF